MRCDQCGSESPNYAKFCWKCGAVLEGHIQRNDQNPKEGFKQRPPGPSYKTIVLVIAMILFLGFSVKLGASFLKKGTSPGSSLTPAPSSLADCCDKDATPAPASNNMGEKQ